MEFEGRTRTRAELSMAPLIDVVFLLLVFFLLTSTFTVPEAIDLTLPNSSTAEEALPDALVVSLLEGGRIDLDGVAVSLGGLPAAIERARESGPDRPVRLAADGGVAVQAMIEVMDALRLAGATEVSIATRPPATLP